MRWVHSVADRVSRRSRLAKFQQFMHLLVPREDETILDVGVADREFSESENYLEKHYARPENIVAVAHTPVHHFVERYPKIRVVVADGRDLPFEDDEFDVAYSNAVVEHVGSFEDQLRFVRELHRVGRRGYMTTPSRHFPIEVHTRLPLLHLLLPKRLFDRVLRTLGKGWAAGDYMYLLSERDLRRLLHEAGIVEFSLIRNRVLGVTMTFTVVWRKAADFRRTTGLDEPTRR